MNVYIWTQGVDSPGIYHNPTEGLISISSDGTTWITIADKNLGATTVYNNGDTLSESNCGKFYQRGNNYGFPFSGTVSKSSSTVNTTSYGPTNYYSSSTFIYNQYDWSSSQNDNLRGNTTNTMVARKGPCDTGYHIPTSTEITNIKTLLTNLGLGGSEISSKLKIPLTGYLSHVDASKVSDSGFFWSSTPSSGYTNRSDSALVSSSNMSVTYLFRADALSIRPFKNESIIPSPSWTVIYQPS